MRWLPSLAVIVAVSRPHAAQPSPCTGPRGEQGKPVYALLNRPELFTGGELTAVSAAIDLDDGGALVVDRISRRVARFGANLQYRADVARQGRGPNELRLPSSLWRLNDERVGIFDASARRMLTYSPKSGTFVGSGIDARIGMHRATGSILIDAFGSDTMGRLYAVAADPHRIAPSARWAKAVVLRGKSGVRAEEILSFDAIGTPASAGEYNGMYFTDPAARKAATDGVVAVALSQRGSIALVTSSPYQVTVTDESGTRFVGDTIHAIPVPIGAAERQILVESLREPVLEEVFPRDRSPSYFRIKRARAQEPLEFPNFLPTVNHRGVLWSSQNTLYVQRSVPAGSCTTYDIFDARGRLTAHASFPIGVTILHIGRRYALAVRYSSTDGEPQLLRFALPAALLK